jgi:hypothetical protein
VNFGVSQEGKNIIFRRRERGGGYYFRTNTYPLNMRGRGHEKGHDMKGECERVRQRKKNYGM